MWYRTDSSIQPNEYCDVLIKLKTGSVYVAFFTGDRWVCPEPGMPTDDWTTLSQEIVEYWREIPK